MIVVTKRSVWRWLVYFAIALGILVLYFTYRQTQETKADRSNAMQVAAVAELEPLPVKEDFFTEYRLERDKLRSERSELLRESLRSAATEESRRAAQEGILALSREKEREAEMESLIRAKGFADALVFCREHSVSAVVKASSLTQDEVVQVADVICRLGNVRQEDVTISVKE